MSDKEIVFLHFAAQMGGVEFSTLYLAGRLDPHRWRPRVICPAEGTFSAASRAAGLAITILPLPLLRSTSLRLGPGDRRLPNPLAWLWNLGAVSAAARQLARFLQDRPPALLVTKGLFAHIYGGLAAHRAGIPCLWHLQDLISERFLGFHRLAIGLLARWLPDFIVVDGSPIAHQLPTAVQERVSVVFNGVDTGIFRPDISGEDVRRELGIPQSALVIGHVARFTPWKGQHLLLEAYSQLAADFPDSRLLLVGSPVFYNHPYAPQVYEQARRLGLDGQVIFAGYREDLPQVFGAMDIFAYPSVEKDTSPLSLLSAMASGLPVVAFDIPGVREVVTSDGLLVPVAQTGPLARALVDLLKDEPRRARLARLSRIRAERDFSLQVYVDNMQAVFERSANPSI